MAGDPKVFAGDWIEIEGDDQKGVPRKVRAVITRTPDAVDPRHRAEVVYLDSRGRAINEDVVWTGDHWSFAMKGPCGGFADQNSSMVMYVRTLRDGGSGR
ncbi:MAG: hypothetical protein R3B81_06885 [bacterium]